MKTEKAKTNMPEGWKMTTLDEAAILSKLPWKPGDRDFKYIGLEHINQGDLTINGYGLSSKLESNKFYFKRNDVLFGKLRPYFRKVWKAKFDGVCSTDIWVIRAKEGNSQDFIFYFFANPEFVNKSTGASTGTRMPRADWTFLKDLEYKFPTFSEQRAIAAVLSSFDDKIEFLREQNKTLEAIAQALYKRWFVEFEFPNEEGKPYKLSGGKMIDSELGEIPAGWKIEQIAELFDFIKGVEPGSSNYVKYKMSDEYTPFYRVQNISGSNNIPDIFIEKSLSNKKIFEENNILVSLDGTIGKVFIGGSGSYSSGIRKVISKNDTIGPCLVYCFLKSDYFQNGLILFSSGETTIKHAGKSLEYLKFVYKQDIFEQFTEITNPIFKKMVVNLAQIQTLSALRDALLPKLISGKIRVPTTPPFGHPSLTGGEFFEDE